MVIVVLAAFAVGSATGVLAMLPSWWRHRREAHRWAAPPVRPAPSASAAPVPPPEHPPRDGL